MSGPFEEVLLNFLLGSAVGADFFSPAFLSVNLSFSPLYTSNLLKYFYCTKYCAYVRAEPPGLQKICLILTIKGSCFHAISSGQYYLTLLGYMCSQFFSVLNLVRGCHGCLESINVPVV